MADTPTLSVVMPVHNALPWLDESVASILEQDDSDFEFVILDDGSTDGSREVLRQWAVRDPRIRLLESDVRLGPVESSNRVVAQARAPLVARMDADDVARPDRLRRQRTLLDSHPDVVLVGSLVELIDRRGRRIRGADFPRLLRTSRFAPLSHPTAMFRRDAFDRAGGYRAEAAMWEDVDLYSRMACEGRVLTIAEPLVRTRAWQGNTRSTGPSDALHAAMTRMYRGVAGEAIRERGKVQPEVLVASASVALWAGRSPGVSGALRDRALLGWNLRSATALVWAAWADLSPKTLRVTLDAILRVRSLAARWRLRDATHVEWRPDEPPVTYRGV